VRRIGSLVVLGLMTTIAYIRCSCVIPIVAGVAIISYDEVGALQDPIVVMDREGGRCPARICCMTFLAGIRDANVGMVGVGSLVISRLVAGKTGVWSRGIIAVMTNIAVSCNGKVCAS
jgi:hypothetical protein